MRASCGPHPTIFAPRILAINPMVCTNGHTEAAAKCFSPPLLSIYHLGPNLITSRSLALLIILCILRTEIKNKLKVQ